MATKYLPLQKTHHTSECEATITEYLQPKQTLDEANEKLINKTMANQHENNNTLF